MKLMPLDLTAEDVVALNQSIAKWKKNAEARTYKGLKLGIDSCPLCKIYHPRHDLEKMDCKGCPIAEATGANYCEKTPYQYFDVTSRDDIADNMDIARGVSIGMASMLRLILNMGGAANHD